jgi:hypothetical protein
VPPSSIIHNKNPSSILEPSTSTLTSISPPLPTSSTTTTTIIDVHSSNSGSNSSASVAGGSCKKKTCNLENYFEWSNRLRLLVANEILQVSFCVLLAHLIIHMTTITNLTILWINAQHRNTCTQKNYLCEKFDYNFFFTSSRPYFLHFFFLLFSNAHWCQYWLELLSMTTTWCGAII